MIHYRVEGRWGPGIQSLRSEDIWLYHEHCFSRGFDGAFSILYHNPRKPWARQKHRALMAGEAEETEAPKVRYEDISARKTPRQQEPRLPVGNLFYSMET